MLLGNGRLTPFEDKVRRNKWLDARLAWVAGLLALVAALRGITLHAGGRK